MVQFLALPLATKEKFSTLSMTYALFIVPYGNCPAQKAITYVVYATSCTMPHLTCGVSGCVMVNLPSPPEFST